VWVRRLLLRVPSPPLDDVDPERLWLLRNCGCCCCRARGRRRLLPLLRRQACSKVC